MVRVCSVLVVVATLAIAGTWANGSSSESLLRLEQCKTFLTLIDKDPIREALDTTNMFDAYLIAMIEDKASKKDRDMAQKKFKTFQKCHRLVEMSHLLHNRITSSGYSGYNPLNRISLGESDSDLIHGGSHRNFHRSDSNDNFGSKCKIKFYPKSQYGGNPTTLYQGTPSIKMGERSLRTFGKCCWLLYKRARFRRPKGRVLVKGGKEMPYASSWKFRPGQIRSVKMIPSC